jgi:hypothetical protein
MKKEALTGFLFSFSRHSHGIRDSAYFVKDL